MIVFLLISFQIGAMYFQRPPETVADIDLCWARARNEMANMRSAHPEITRIAAGCVIDDGTSL